MDAPIVDFLHRRAHGHPDLAAGIAAVAAGSVVTAAQHLGAVVDASPDQLERARAAAYHRLATHLRWNAFPGDGGAGATEITVRWDRAPSAIDEREDWAAAARAGGDPATLTELRVVSALCALRSVRVIVDHAAARLAPADVDAQLDEALGVLAPLRDADDPSLRGYASFAAADLAHRARRPQRAAQLLRDAAAVYGGAGDRTGLGACHLLRGDWRAAPATRPDIRNLTLVASAAESSALDWAVEATEASLTGLDTDGAAAAYAEAEEAFADAGAADGVAAVVLRRGYLAGLAGDHAEAVRLAGAAAAVSAECGDGWGAWLARVHEALSAIAAGQRTAEDTATEGVAAWGTETGSFSYALGLGLLCSRSGRDWLYRRADPTRALACHRLAHGVFVALGAVTDQAQALVDRGRVLHVIGDIDGAAGALEQALDLLARDVDARPAAAADNRLRAITLAQSVYLLHLAQRNATGMARGAERLRAQAARLPQDAGDDTVEGMLADAADATLAQVPVLVPLYRGQEAREAGDAAAADAAYAEALDAAHAFDSPDAGFLEAVVLGHWRRYAEAAAAFGHYLDAQTAPRGLVSRVLSRLGPLKSEFALAQQRMHEQAGAFFRRLRDYPAAVSHYRALERSGGPQCWDRLERPWEALTDYGAACEAIGDLSRALRLHDEAITRLERRPPGPRPDEPKPALGSTSGTVAVYLAAARTALRMAGERAGGDAGGKAGGDAGGKAGGDAGGRAGGDAGAWAAKAFDYAERGRVRGLLDLLSAGLGLAPVPAGTAPVRAWHQAKAELSVRQGLLAVEHTVPHPDPDRLAALGEQITATEQTVLDRAADLEQAEPAFAATVAVPGRVMGVDAVRAQLPQGTALLAYHHLDEDLLAWALTAGDLASHRATVDGAQLARDVGEFARACARGGDWQLRGAALAGTLLDPFAELLHRVDRLIVVPPPAAHAMPFHALPWRGAPLGASHAVSYLPSASSLQLAAAGAVLPDRVLAVGDPAAPAWQALPGHPPGPAPARPAAATEAAAVAALFDDAQLLVGAAATGPAVRSAIGAWPVVHLATHAQVCDAAPMLSSVLLAGGDALSIYELLGMPLDADLVVASADDAERGIPGAGGDPLALARGLLGAGARGVVVRLWPVPGRATCVLMARFYRLLRGGVPAPVALQAAQTHLRCLSAEAEAAEFAALAAAAADPSAAARAALAPISDASPAPEAGGRERHPDVWAGFCYVGGGRTQNSLPSGSAMTTHATSP